MFAQIQIFFVLLVGLSSGFFTCVAKSEEIIKVGIENNPPGAFIDKDGVPQGLFVDLLEEIAKREQWTLEYIHEDWTVLLKKLENNEINLLASISYSTKRDKIFDFIDETVAIKWGTVYIKPNSNIKIFPDLDRKRVAAVDGSIHTRNFEEITRDFDIQPILINVDQSSTVLELVESGEADAGVVNSTFGYLEEENYRVERTAIVFHPTSSTFATPENKYADLRKTIDTYLKQWKADRTSIYYESYNHWYGGKEFVKETVPKWLIFVLIGGTTGVIVIFFWNQTLTREIERRKVLELELQASKEKAEVANQAKSIFIANMSHELRSPLNAIMGFAQLMLRSQDLSPQQQENINIINCSGEYLLTLINNVLDFSKIEAGKATLNVQNFDLHRLLVEIEDIFSLRAEDRQIQLLFECEENVPRYIRTDRTKLSQILINLLGNAIKFTTEGGVSVRTTLKNNLSEETTILYFEVEDTGVGIAEAERDRLFEAFGQTQSGKESREGTGLGLPISRQFVRLMGGEITVSSRVGKGTIFAFDICVERVSDLDIEKESTQSRIIGLAANQPCYKILVVDDKAINRKLLIKLLQPLGFELQEASNGKEAIEIWDRWEPHLIWMDIRMPVIDGHQAITQIKGTTKGQATVIIALTASVFEEEKAILFSVGCDDFVRKPFRESTIFAIMSKHLGIEYIYEQDTAISPKSLSAPLTLESFQGIEKDWLIRLHRAAFDLDDEEIISLIVDIADTHQSLAASLTDLVNQFRCDEIVDVLKPLLSTRSDKIPR